MPIEVRELIIKVRVEESASASASAPANGTRRQQSLSEKELQKIVALCSEEVMKTIKRQKER